MNYAAHQFRMQDDMSLAQIDPPVLDYIWRWFGELSDCRETGMGLGPIMHLEIAAWARLRGLDVSPAEAGALRQIDRTFLQYVHAKMNPDKKTSISDTFADIAAISKAKRDTEQRRKARKPLAVNETRAQSPLFRAGSSEPEKETC